MPVVHVNVWEGFGPQKARAAIEGITQVLADLGIPRQAVEVLVHEVPKSHWGIGGQPASERAGGEPPPEAKAQEAAGRTQQAGREL
jgi:4-oxalocrotonate tautomerase